MAQRGGESVEFLAERHWHGILHLRAADLEDLRELVGLRGKGALERLELAEQVLEREGEGDLDRRRVGVVGRLAAVDVVDRAQHVVAALLVAGMFERHIADHFVGVHVGGGSGPTLDDADDELLVELAVDDVLAGLVDPAGSLGREGAELLVGPGAGLLHGGERDDEVGVDGDGTLGDREVVHGPLGVHAPVGVLGHLEWTERIAFDAEPRGRVVGHVGGRSVGWHCGSIAGGDELAAPDALLYRGARARDQACTQGIRAIARPGAGNHCTGRAMTHVNPFGYLSDSSRPSRARISSSTSPP